MLDLYEMFLEDDGKEKPAETKKPAAKKEKKASEKKYQLPMALNMDGIVQKLEHLEDGRTEATMKELREEIAKNWNWYPADITNLEVDEAKGMAFLTYRQEGAAKGSITVEDGDRFVFGQTEIEYAEHIDEESGTVEVSNLQSVFQAAFPQYFEKNSKSWEKISILRSGSTGVMVPVLPIVSVSQVPVSNMITLVTTKCIITFTKEEQLTAIQERLKDTVAGESSVLETEDIARLLKGKGLYFEDRIAVAETGIKETYSAWIKPKQPERQSVKEELYPVKGITLSLYYVRYELSPEEFGGKEEVTKGELLAFLVRKNHPEYEYTDVRINYLKKEKVILVTTSGSRKGAIFRDMEHFQIDGRMHRRENGLPVYKKYHNPMFSAAIPKDPDGVIYFSWNIKKIPDFILAQGAFISHQVYQHFQTEVSLDLYYSSKGGQFFWNPPAQKGTPSGVSTETEAFLEASYCSGLIKVGQGHSHGEYPAFFSSQDDADERMPGIYCVWGSFGEEKASFCMRVGMGEGQFLEIDPERIFEKNIAASNEMSAVSLLNLTFKRLMAPYREPTYPCLRVGGHEVLAGFRPIHPYVRAVYDACTGIFLYGLRDGVQSMEISEQCREDSCGFLISAEKLDCDLLKCLPRYCDGNWGNEKTIMEYIEDCMKEV